MSVQGAPQKEGPYWEAPIQKEEMDKVEDSIHI